MQGSGRSGPALDDVDDPEILDEKEGHRADHRAEGQGDEELVVAVGPLIAIFGCLVGHLSVPSFPLVRAWDVSGGAARRRPAAAGKIIRPTMMPVRDRRVVR